MMRPCRPHKLGTRQFMRNARFVSDLASPVVELLAPKPGERILDLGCGDGVLTKKLVDMGCEVVAVDSSVPQIEAAKKLGLNASRSAAKTCHTRRNSMPCSVTPRCTG